MTTRLATAALSLTFVGACASVARRPTEPPPQTACPSAVVSSATVAPTASATPPTFFGDAAIRLAWFDKLVAEVRRLHVFTAQVKTNLGRTFDDELPDLRDEVVAATDTEHVVGALHHLGNALHNAHSFFDPARRGTSLDLGVTVRTEWQGDQVRFYVAKVQRPPVDGAIAEGDYLESVDGTPASALLTGLLRESDANNWRGVAKDEARYLTSRSTSRSLVREDQRTSWTVSGKGGSQKVTLAWRKSAGGGEPTAAAYTSTRLRWPVTLPDGTQLGVIHLAFADDVSGKTKISIEAVPLPLTRPIDRTRANDGTYDRQLVEAAIGELKKRKKT